MCGIAGIQIFEGHRLPDNTQAENVLKAMTKRLDHRGPDDQGTLFFSADKTRSNNNPPKRNAGLGNTRLAIQDPSSKGRQPMVSNHHRHGIVFNGEIYNFRDLRSKFDRSSNTNIHPSDRNNRWSSDTDTEVLLEAYRKWGSKCLERLRGMFAFAVWDGPEGKLFLARDRLGIKPLYYVKTDEYFLFASEIRALLASGLVRRHIDPSALHQYLQYQSVSAPRTLVQDVKMLPPGSTLTIKTDGSMKQNRYWNLWQSSEKRSSSYSIDQSKKHLRKLLMESINLHLVSDVPIGAFLSGGIDSSIVVGLMKKAGVTPNTFTVGFSNQEFDESEYAEQVADRFQTNHRTIRLSEEKLLNQIPEAVSAMDHPTGDGINTYIVSRAVRKTGLKVALSGLGGDELFGGYPSFKRIKNWTKYFQIWGRTPSFLRRAIAKCIESLSGNSVKMNKMISALESDGSIPSLMSIFRQVLSPSRSKEILDTSFINKQTEITDPYQRVFDEISDGMSDDEHFFSFRNFYYSLVSCIEARTYMHDVLLRDTDQMSMAHGLEVRVPLLDHRLAEFVMKLPDGHKTLDNGSKPLLVTSLEGLLPESIIQRPKQGFTLPFQTWMKGPLKSYCDKHLNSSGLGNRPFIQQKPVQRLWQAFLNDDESVTWSRIWLLVALEEWLERNRMTI